MQLMQFMQAMNSSQDNTSFISLAPLRQITSCLVELLCLRIIRVSLNMGAMLSKNTAKKNVMSEFGLRTSPELQDWR